MWPPTKPQLNAEAPAFTPRAQVAALLNESQLPTESESLRPVPVATEEDEPKISEAPRQKEQATKGRVACAQKQTKEEFLAACLTAATAHTPPSPQIQEREQSDQSSKFHAKQRAAEAYRQAKEERLRAKEAARKALALANKATQSTASHDIIADDAPLSFASEATAAPDKKPFETSFEKCAAAVQSFFIAGKEPQKARMIIEDFFKTVPMTHGEILFIMQDVSKTSLATLYYEALYNVEKENALPLPLGGQFQDISKFMVDVISQQLIWLTDQESDVSHALIYLEKIHALALANSSNPTEEHSSLSESTDSQSTASLEALHKPITFSSLEMDSTQVPFETLCTLFQHEMDTYLAQAPIKEESFIAIICLIIKLFKKARSKEELLMALEKTTLRPSTSFIPIEALLIFLGNKPHIALSRKQLTPLLSKLKSQLEQQIAVITQKQKQELSPLLTHLQRFLPAVIEKLAEITKDQSPIAKFKK